MKPKKMADPAILLRVASATIEDARKAWRRVARNESERSLRSAYRACVLAARCARRAAKALAHDEIEVRRLSEDARKLDAVAAELVSRLATAVVGPRDEANTLPK